MAYNPIQFQQGMSLPEFLQCFGTEAACAEAVRGARWPDGFSARAATVAPTASSSAAADPCFSATHAILRPR